MEKSREMADDSTAPSHVYLPGDVVDLPASEQASAEKIFLGPGLRKYGKDVLVTKSGLLRRKAHPLTYWIDCHQKRYVPARGDNVIGTVVNKLGDSYKLQIGSHEEASLSSLAFAGATKKNRPQVAIGDLVFAKLLNASVDMEPELVCVDSLGQSAGLGPLSNEGFLFSVPLHHVRRLLSPECPLLKTLGRAMPFETAVGANGRVWIKSKSLRQTLTAARAIAGSERLDEREMAALCKRLADGLPAF